MWQRYLIAGLAAALCTGAGLALAGQYRARARQLDAAVLLVTQLEARLRLAPLSTAALFEELTARSQLRQLPFVAHTASALRENACFPAVWAGALSAARPALALREADYTVLSALGDLLGSLDADTAAAELALLRGSLTELRSEAAEQARTDGRLTRSLGLLAGLAAGILFL